MNTKIYDELNKLVRKALKKDEIPVGCIILYNNKIIAKCYNKKEKNHCCIDHAEIIAIRQASKKLKDWRLDKCEMFVTLEPCEMCKNAIKQARIKKCTYLLNSNYNNENHKNSTFFEETKEQIKKEYQQVLRNYFKNKR